MIDNKKPVFKMDKQSWVIKLVALRLFLGGMEEFFIVPTTWYYVHFLGQTKFFLAQVLSSYCIGPVVTGPLIGSIADRSEDPRFLFICCCTVST